MSLLNGYLLAWFPEAAAYTEHCVDNRTNIIQTALSSNYVAASMPLRVISIPNPGASLGTRYPSTGNAIPGVAR